MKSHFLVPVLSILSLSTISYATENQLDDVVVTATKTAISADQSIVPVVVITADDIEKSPAMDLPGLLSGTAGINIASAGGFGQQTSLFVRGTNSTHTLVIIDGVKVGSLSSGFTALEHISLDQIERIELIKGSRSSLYGSDAIGGVLQIFTKKGSGDVSGFHPAVTIGAGSNDTNKVGFSVSGGMGGFTLGMNGVVFHTGGIDATLESNFNNDPDEDKYNNDSISLNIGKLWNNGVKLDLLYMNSNGEVEYDGGNFRSDIKNSLNSLKLYVPASDKLDVTLQISESVDDLTSFGAWDSRNKSRRRQQNLQTDYYVTDLFQVSFGLERQQDKLNSSNYADQKTKSQSRYFQGLFDSEMVGVLVGFRHDDYGNYGDEDTWNIGARLNISDSIKLTANNGTAFKAPNFNQMFWPGGGNPDLLPEKSRSYEIGAAYQTKQMQLQLNMYRTKVENLISGWPSSNINRAQISGEELIVNLTNNRIADLAIELSHVDSRDKASGERLLKRPIKSAKVTVAKEIGAVDIALTAIGYSSSLGWGGTESAGYGVFNGAVNYALNDHVKFSLKGENLFDKEYSPVYGYSSKGRSFMLEMKAGF